MKCIVFTKYVRKLKKHKNVKHLISLVQYKSYFTKKRVDNMIF